MVRINPLDKNSIHIIICKQIQTPWAIATSASRSLNMKDLMPTTSSFANWTLSLRRALKMNPSPRCLPKTTKDPLNRPASKTWRKRSLLTRNVSLKNHRNQPLLRIIIMLLTAPKCQGGEGPSSELSKTRITSTPQMKMSIVPEGGPETEGEEEKPMAIQLKTSSQTSKDHTYSSWNPNWVTRGPIPSRSWKSSRTKMGSRCTTTKLSTEWLSSRRPLRSSSGQDTSTESWCCQEVLWKPEKCTSRRFTCLKMPSPQRSSTRLTEDHPRVRLISL